MVVLALCIVLASCSRARREPVAEYAPTKDASPVKEAAPKLDYRVPRPASTDDLVSVAIEKTWDAVDFYEDEATLQRTLAPATPGQRAVLAARWYEAEVSNGGHDQYFFNSTGMLWEEALAGLALLGAEQHRALLERAIALFPDQRPSKDRFERQTQLEQVDSELLGKLDDELYALDSLELHMLRYIEAHPDQFFR